MKKVRSLLLFSLLLFSCALNSKKDLYKRQISVLLQNNFYVNENIPFYFQTSVTKSEERQKVQIMFFEPQMDLMDFTAILLDSRQKNVSDAPINVGFFSESINFVKQKTNKNDQTKLRFNFYCDIENPKYNCAVSFLEGMQRLEVFFVIEVK